MIILAPFLLKPSVNAMAIFPFILIKHRRQKTNNQLINHEKIHIKQQIEMLCIFFFLWYITEYCIRLIIYKNSNKAYLNICFEKEAYLNDHDLGYLSKRKFWAFLKYI